MEMTFAERAAVASAVATVDGVPCDLIDAQGRLVITPHALTLDGQRNVPADLRPGESLADFLARHVPGIDPAGWSVAIGGLSVPGAMWARTYPRHGHLIAARSVARKTVVKLAAIAAVAWLTVGAGAMWIAGTFGVTAGGFAASMIGYGLFVAGATLINKVLAPKVSASSSSDSSASTVYSLSGQRNSARAYEPIGTLLGQMRVTPDLASQSYTWYEGDDAYMAVILLGGINVHSVSDLSIGDTPLSSYDDVTVYYNGFSGMASEAIPLYSNADTVDGGSLEWDATDPWVLRTSSTDTVALGVDVEANLYASTSSGIGANSTLLTIEYRAVGATDWTAWTATTLTSSTADVLRRSYYLDVPAGQYEVRARIAQPSSTGSSDVCTVVWSGLKSVQPDSTDYAQWGRFAIKIRATGQINGSLDTVRATLTPRPLPLWTGSEWIDATTREEGLSNPGGIILQVLRGIYAPDGALQYGWGLSDEQIDVEGLKEFMLHCTEHGYTYDRWHTSSMNCGDLCSEVALAGMGQFQWIDGSRPTVAYAASTQPISAVVNMATMLKSTFSVGYALTQSADGIELQYVDRDRDFETTTLRVASPGVDTPTNPARITAEGVTTAAHAAIIARYHLAQSLYQYKTIGYSTDLEHLDYRRMALLSLSHDLTQWGYGGRLVAAEVVGGSVVLTLDEPVPALAAFYVGLRVPAEKIYRIFSVRPFEGTTNTITLLDEWPADVAFPGAASDNPAHDTIWCFDFKATPGYKVRVVSVAPMQDLEGAEVAVVPESAEFWDYVLNGTYTPAPNESSLANALPVASNARIVLADRVRIGEAWRTQLSITFDVSGDFYRAQLWATVDGQAPYLLQGGLSSTRASWYADKGQQWTVEVRPFDPLGRMGTKATATYTIATNAPDNVLGLSVTVTGTGVVATWAAPTGQAAVDWSLTELRTGAAWETGTSVFSGRATSYNLGWLAAGLTTVWASHRNTAGEWSAAASYGITIVAPAQPVVSGSADVSVARIDWQDCTTSQPIRYYAVSLGLELATAALLNNITATSYTRQEAAGRHRYWVVPYDMAGNAGAAGYLMLETDSTISEALTTLQQDLGTYVEQLLAQISITSESAGVRVTAEAQKRAQALLDEALARGTAITQEQTLRQEEDAALAQLLDTLTAVVENDNGALVAALQNEETARVDGDTALASDITLMGARITNAEGDIEGQSIITSGLQTSVTQQGDDISALAVSFETLTVQVGDQSASISEIAQAVIDVDGRFSATYTFQMEVGGYVSGIIANNDGTTSDMVLLFDRFAIAQNVGGVITYPFVVGTVGGVSAVGIDGNLFVDGSVNARSLNIGAGNNLLPSTTFTDGLTGWSVADNLGGVTSGVDLSGWYPIGGHAAWIYQDNADYAGTDHFAEFNSNAFTAQAGQRYEFSVGTGVHRAVAHALLVFKDAGGGVIGQQDSATDNTDVAGGTSISGYKRIGNFATAPEGTASAQLLVRKGPTLTGEADSYLFVTEPYVGIANSAQATLSAYSPSGVGVKITPEGIETPSLSAISANFGTVTAGRMQNAANTTWIDLDSSSLSFGEDLTYDPVNGLKVNKLSVIGTAQLAGQSVTDLTTATGGSAASISLTLTESTAVLCAASVTYDGSTETVESISLFINVNGTVLAQAGGYGFGASAVGALVLAAGTHSVTATTGGEVGAVNLSVLRCKR